MVSRTWLLLYHLLCMQQCTVFAKVTVQYVTAPIAIQLNFDEYRIVCAPAKITTDFEMPVKKYFQTLHSIVTYSSRPVSLPINSVCRSSSSVQLSDDRLLKIQIHTMISLAFVPLSMEFYRFWRMMHLTIFWQFLIILKNIMFLGCRLEMEDLPTSILKSVQYSSWWFA